MADLMQLLADYIKQRRGPSLEDLGLSKTTLESLGLRSPEDTVWQTRQAAGPRGATLYGKPLSTAQLQALAAAEKPPVGGVQRLKPEQQGYEQMFPPERPADILDQQELNDVIAPPEPNPEGVTTTATINFAPQIAAEQCESGGTRTWREVLFFYDRTAIPQLTVEQVKNNALLVPPEDEQSAITEYLLKTFRHFDQLDKKLKSQLTKLHEYRQELITAAVTGQVAIPEEVA